ncbi:MAG: PD-(D/E)XK nuclease family protein [Bacteroidales bacterium]|nr:PD-(D/E)XK nuclease family protein [Bacteroidales bacterium]
MIPFLRQVARHYYNGSRDISSLCFVFPNRRAVRFFEHYLGEEIAASGRGPVISPALYTINDFIYHSTEHKPSDRIPLLLELYACYKDLNPGAEPLDDFIFWGDALLSDFDDIDKYLVEPEHLFANVSELREMQDDYSYLTEEQRKAILRFVDHFKSPGSIKEGFLRIWKILLPLYKTFKERLAQKGLAYEGMVYREFAGILSSEGAASIMQKRFPWSERFVFVGLNALNECEKVLLRRMHRAKLAEFCWDFRSEAIRNPDNKSSFFLRDFVLEFPSAFEPDPEGLPHTEFNALSVPGGIAQAKQLPEILSRCTPEPGIETAVVLPDENLLIPVLNSIPEHITKLNVTMGYPIGGSQMWSLVTDLCTLQLHLRQKGDEWHFYHRQLWAVVSNSIVKNVIADEEKEALESLRKQRLYYIPEGTMSEFPVLGVLFRPVAKSNAADPAQIRSLCSWLMEVLGTVAPKLKDKPELQLELDFAKVCFEALQKLSRYDFNLMPSSFFRLLGQVLGASTVPFQGEPLEGMQIMGPLELRAMDFDNLIILSCNEGVFPRRSVSASFIPPELRKGFGLPTYEYQDAVWAYYFYRMIQRCSRVWMVYDSRTEGLRGGEPSRYLRQLEMHFGIKFSHFEARTGLGRGADEEQIPKTEADLEKLHACNLSASSIRNYLVCPAKFYYSKVKGLEAEKEVSESLDAGMLGNVLHKTMQELYPRGTVAGAAFIGALLKDKKRIRSTVEKYICSELKTFEVSGRNLIFADVICSYVEAILSADLSCLPPGGALSIKGTEKFVRQDIRGYSFVGYIDRLDSLSEGSLRVVDYKTGRVEPADLVFDPKKDDVPQIGLQLWLYKRLLTPDVPRAAITGAIYQPAALISGSGVYALELNEEYCSKMEAALNQVLDEISDLSVPWSRREKLDKCAYCDFRAICGR